MPKQKSESRSASKNKHVSGKKLVIVESPTKARTIRRFLGSDFIVESCMGHVRDLPDSARDIPEKFKKLPWANLGVNIDQNFEPFYVVPRNKTKVVSQLKTKLQEAEALYLATDEDREGESISWHLLELLKPKVPVYRMVFNEITKTAIQRALQETRDIDQNLVKAQETRRVLDRLVGYTISPLLWKKISYGLSAGRVQSVAVKLLAEREIERLKFKKSFYWGIEAELSHQGQKFKARLVKIDDSRVATGKDFSEETGNLRKSHEKIVLLTAERAQELSERLKSCPWTVQSVDERPVFRKPPMPFITSTLQQEANRKLGLSAREAMQVAQKLYEQGFITYMRTDSPSLSQEAIQASREQIRKKFGVEYLPKEARIYESKSKAAQEAHEAIRPAGNEFQNPDETGLSGMPLKLYEMIWKRTLASQMKDCEQRQIQVKLFAGNTEFAANGNVIDFPGFLRAYVEGSDDPDAELSEREVILPNLKVKDLLKVEDLIPKEHETKPPARYTEASLVQRLEKEGIGRPSTYAAILGTIVDRGYARRVGQMLIPTFTGLIVTKFLQSYLPDYVDLKFTRKMEEVLDEIASGDKGYLEYLSQLYKGKNGLAEMIKTQEKTIDPAEAREIKLAALETFKFRVGRFGAYVCKEVGGKEICASIPDQISPADLTKEKVEELIQQKITGADALGKDPETGKAIYVLTGRYGPYVQLGDQETDEKPKAVSLPQGLEPSEVNLDKALFLLSLPRLLGHHPDSGEKIFLGNGRFGPYVKIQNEFRSVPKEEDLFSFDLKKALDLLSTPKKQSRGRSVAKVLRTLGPHPENKEPIEILEGKYGPYCKWGKINASLPKDRPVDQVTLDEVLPLLDEKLAKNPSKGVSRSASR